MSKTVALPEATYNKLVKLKAEVGVSTFAEVIEALIEASNERRREKVEEYVRKLANPRKADRVKEVVEKLRVREWWREPY